jgi:hypothetical protein
MRNRNTQKYKTNKTKKICDHFCGKIRKRHEIRYREKHGGLGPDGLIEEGGGDDEPKDEDSKEDAKKTGGFVASIKKIVQGPAFFIKEFILALKEILMILGRSSFYVESTDVFVERKEFSYFQNTILKAITYFYGKAMYPPYIRGSLTTLATIRLMIDYCQSKGEYELYQMIKYNPYISTDSDYPKYNKDINSVLYKYYNESKKYNLSIILTGHASIGIGINHVGTGMGQLITHGIKGGTNESEEKLDDTTDEKMEVFLKTIKSWPIMFKDLVNSNKRIASLATNLELLGKTIIKYILKPSKKKGVKKGGFKQGKKSIKNGGFKQGKKTIKGVGIKKGGIFGVGKTLNKLRNYTAEKKEQLKKTIKNVGKSMVSFASTGGYLERLLNKYDVPDESYFRDKKQNTVSSLILGLLMFRCRKQHLSDVAMNMLYDKTTGKCEQIETYKELFEKINMSYLDNYKCKWLLFFLVKIHNFIDVNFTGIFKNTKSFENLQSLFKDLLEDFMKKPTDDIVEQIKIKELLTNTITQISHYLEKDKSKDNTDHMTFFEKINNKTNRRKLNDKFKNFIIKQFETRLEIEIIKSVNISITQNNDPRNNPIKTSDKKEISPDDAMLTEKVDDKIIQNTYITQPSSLHTNMKNLTSAQLTEYNEHDLELDNTENHYYSTELTCKRIKDLLDDNYKGLNITGYNKTKRRDSKAFFIGLKQDSYNELSFDRKLLKYYFQLFLKVKQDMDFEDLTGNYLDNLKTEIRGLLNKCLNDKSVDSIKDKLIYNENPINVDEIINSITTETENKSFFVLLQLVPTPEFKEIEEKQKQKLVEKQKKEAEAELRDDEDEYEDVPKLTPEEKQEIEKDKIVMKTEEKYIAKFEKLKKEIEDVIDEYFDKQYNENLKHFVRSEKNDDSGGKSEKNSVNAIESTIEKTMKDYYTHIKSDISGLKSLETQKTILEQNEPTEENKRKITEKIKEIYAEEKKQKNRRVIGEIIKYDKIDRVNKLLIKHFVFLKRITELTLSEERISQNKESNKGFSLNSKTLSKNKISVGIWRMVNARVKQSYEDHFLELLFRGKDGEIGEISAYIIQQNVLGIGATCGTFLTDVFVGRFAPECITTSFITIYILCVFLIPILYKHSGNQKEMERLQNEISGTAEDTEKAEDVVDENEFSKTPGEKADKINAEKTEKTKKLKERIEVEEKKLGVYKKELKDTKEKLKEIAILGKTEIEKSSKEDSPIDYKLIEKLNKNSLCVVM